MPNLADCHAGGEGVSAPLIGFGSRVRTSPFYAATRRHGCKAYSIYNHTFMPLYYESPEADYWHLVTDVTLWDVAAERQVQIAVRPDWLVDSLDEFEW